MLTKSREFELQFENDKKLWLKISDRELWSKGFYTVKNYGDFITDIDLQANVDFNQNLITKISQVIEQINTGNSPFKFLYMSIGHYQKYNLPWNIDSVGGCSFNLERSYSWYESVKNKKLLPTNILKYIHSKLYNDKLRIRDLIDIESVICPFSEIIWEYENISVGYIIHENIRYDLLEEMKKELPVMEFIYEYNGKYISVNVNLIDKNFQVKPRKFMYKYYINDWYKILKNLRWKISEIYKQEYYDDMKKIDKILYIKQLINLYRKAEKYQILQPENIKKLNNEILNLLSQNFDKNIYKLKSLIEIENVLYDIINTEMKKYIDKYISVCDSSTKNEMLLYMKRGVESQIYTTKNMLLSREKKDIKCPFFHTDIDDFIILVDLSNRTTLNTEKIIECFVDVSNNLNIPIKTLIAKISKNRFFIKFENNNKNIILYDANTQRKTFVLTTENIKALQKYIIFGIPYNIL